MSAAYESQDDPIPDQLVDQLIKGYDALGEEVRFLHEQRRALENRLSWAKQQVWPHNFVVHFSLPLFVMNNLSSRSVASASTDNNTNYHDT